MPEEAGRPGHRELGFELQQGMLLQAGRRHADHGGEAHADQQRCKPLDLARDQHVVDEHPGEHRQDHPEQRQHGADHADIGQGGPGRLEPRGEQAEEFRRRAAALELRSRLEGQGDAGEGFRELREADAAPALDRIVQQGLPVSEPLKHQEVVEVPVQDQRPRQIGQLVGVLPEALRRQAIGAGCLEDVAGLGAVARHAAGLTQLLERNPAPVMRQHHGQGRGSALHLFHLQDRGGAGDPPGRAAAVGHRPEAFLRNGSTKLMGGWLRTVTSASARVPLPILASGPLPEAHR